MLTLKPILRAVLLVCIVAEHESDLCTIIVEDAHQADRYCLVDAATQSLPGEGKHIWHPLFTTGVDYGVKSLIQASCKK